VEGLDIRLAVVTNKRMYSGGERCGGVDTILVSRIAGVARDCNTLGASLSIYYDSLIEKCSTLSRLCAAQGWSAFFSPKSKRTNGMSPRSVTNGKG
jgi:hypothetical protein